MLQIYSHTQRRRFKRILKVIRCKFSTEKRKKDVNEAILMMIGIMNIIEYEIVHLSSKMDSIANIYYELGYPI